jgi:hypothetical protein
LELCAEKTLVDVTKSISKAQFSDNLGLWYDVELAEDLPRPEK